MARCSRFGHLQQCVLLVVCLVTPSYSCRDLRQQQLASDVRHSEQVLEAAVAPGDARRPLTTNSTCARGDSYIDCYADPCAYFPCPVGYLGEPSGCGGTCRCSCRTGNNLTSITNATTGVTGPVNVANTAVNTAAADSEQQELFHQQQQQQHSQCFAAYEYCTCSTQCCGGLICGYPLRLKRESGLHAANSSNVSSSANNSRISTSLINSTTPAGESGNGSSSNDVIAGDSSARGAASVATILGVNNGSINNLQEAAVNVGGPSCRTLEETDGISGVINYGC